MSNLISTGYGHEAYDRRTGEGERFLFRQAERCWSFVSREWERGWYWVRNDEEGDLIIFRFYILTASTLRNCGVILMTNPLYYHFDSDS